MNPSHLSKMIPFNSILLLLISSTLLSYSQSLSLDPKKIISRRDAMLLSGASTIMAGMTTAIPSISHATSDDTSVDLDTIKSITNKSNLAILPSKDPSPFMLIRGGIKGKSLIKMPRVGYSLYKTAPDTAARCTALAIRSGVRHFDVGTLYGSNSQVGSVFKTYIDGGMDAIDYSAESSELLALCDKTRIAGDEHALQIVSAGTMLLGNNNNILAPTPMGSAGRRGRRERLFISHKVSNAEQSMKRSDVKRAVKQQILELNAQYLDLVSIHSPLTDANRRRETYGALIELRDAGLVKSVGVCNYGIKALMEIQDNGFELPSINQLELSPFNTHSDIISFCKEHDIAVSCAAWSKLSGTDGPADQWAILSDIAKKKGMTKAQVLVRWSLQKGFACVPRSGCGSKIERIAITENSYGGVNLPDRGNILTDEEMSIIDSLNINYKAGKLGRRDGWGDDDVESIEWDPTNFF